jgi:adenosylhomocysteine nucleosidase
MSSKVAIVAALPREIAGLVRGVSADAELLRRGVHLYRLNEAVLVAAGMGEARAVLAVEAALAVSVTTTVISVGLAGACSSELAAGAVAQATLVIDAMTGERFAADSPSEQACVLVTTDAIAGVQEKARLAASYGASLVDMEAAAVARQARARGLGFRAIKAVSDAHDFELAALARFTGKQGSFRTGAFALHTALRPQAWAKTMKLGRDSSRALSGLDRVLRDILANG